MALHEQCVGATDEWYTPPHVFDALGCKFSMDVSSPGGGFTPWIPATEFVTYDSLTRAWRGFVWMNPPFGGRNGLVPWLEKFFAHGNGIALAPDRTVRAVVADVCANVRPDLVCITETEIHRGRRQSGQIPGTRNVPAGGRPTRRRSTSPGRRAWRADATANYTTTNR
jgi:hypothetical protein